MAERRILIIEDDKLMAECLKRAVRGLGTVEVCADAVAGMAMMAERVPDVLMLDVMLPGYNGFAILNELRSYADAMKMAVILVTSLELRETDLGHYGVKAILDKATMTPKEIRATIEGLEKNE